MRSIMSVLLALVIIYGVLKYFKENALENLKYSRTFNRKRLYAGESLTLKVELSNHKLLPLPWLRMVATYPSDLTIKGQKLQGIKGFLKHNHIAITSLFSFQKLTKTYEVTCEKRGFYTFCDVELKAGDWFGLENAEKIFYVPDQLIVYPKVFPLHHLGFEPNKPDGTVSVNRWIMPDPIEKIGLRDYSYSEPFHAIDWKATARTGQMMVANFDHKAEPAIMILLNTVQFKADWKYSASAHYEDLINVAASIVEEASKESVAVGMGYTAAVQSAKVGQLILPDNLPGQRLVLLELLAKLSEYNKISAEDMLNLYERIYEPHHTIFFLTESITPELALRLNHLASNGYDLNIALLEESDCLHMLSRGIKVHYPKCECIDGGAAHVQMA